MKKNYIVFLLAILCSASIAAQAIQTKFINYQGVARTAENQLMANETMVVGIDLKIGGAAEAPSYSENHSISTDANGVFSLKIGNGDVVSGDYYNFPWGGLATFVTVSINGLEVGTTEMTAVPYALSSGDGAPEANQVPYDNSVSGLAATNAQEAIDALAGGGTIDTDNQALVLTDDVLTIQDGAGSIDLSNYIEDADADINNELQTLNFDAATNELSLSDGNSVIIPSGGTDADADPTNELQDITLSGTELAISDGSTVDLGSIGSNGGSDDQDLVLTGDILTIESGAGSVDLSDYRDGDLTAESGILLGDGTAVTGLEGTSDGQVPKWNAATSSWAAGTDATGSGGSSLWTANNNDVYFEGGRVGVGTTSPTTNMEISGTGVVLQTITSTNAAVTGLVLKKPGDLNLDWSMTNVPDGLSFNYSNNDNASATIHTQMLDNGDLKVNGGIESQNLQGTGQRNVVADSDGKLVIGSGGGTTASGLEAIDEGNGIGWRLIGGDPDEYDDIAFRAVDLSYGNFDSNDDGLAGAGGRYSFATGVETRASGWISTAMGIGAKAEGSNSVAIGVRPIASGEGSIAIGALLKAESQYTTVVGINNIGGGSDIDWIPTDPLFEIGNGQFTRNNALTVLKNGNMGIGSHNPKSALDIAGGKWDLDNTDGDFRIGADAIGLRIGVATSNGPGGGNVHIRAQGGTTNSLRLGSGNNDGVLVVRDQNVFVNGVLTHSSDRRLKEDITDLPYGLQEIVQLQPKAYHWKKNKTKERLSLGLIAQEVQIVVKELVHQNTNEENSLSVNYIELIPILIKAMQEQQDMIVSLQNEQESFQSQLATLKTQLTELVNLQDKKDTLLKK